MKKIPSKVPKRISFAISLSLILASCGSNTVKNAQLPKIENNNLEVTIGRSNLSTLDTNVSKDSYRQVNINDIPVKFTNDELIVKFDGDEITKNKNLSKFLTDKHAILISDLKPSPPPKDWDKKLNSIPDTGYRVLKLPRQIEVTTEKLKEQLKRINSIGKFDFVTPESASQYSLMLEINSTSNETGVSAQVNGIAGPEWAPQTTIDHKDSNYPGGFRNNTDYLNIAGMNISGPGNAHDIWQANTQGRSTHIMVIDAGFDTNNYDLTGFDPYGPYLKYLPKNMNVRKSTDNGATTYNGIVDYPYHGTKVAAVIAASSVNHYGASGVFPEGLTDIGWDAHDDSLAPGYVTWANVAKGINTAASWNVDVISISLGGWDSTCSNSVIQSAVNNAANVRSIVVVSAGNNNASIPSKCSPSPGAPQNTTYAIMGALNNVISVGAVDAQNHRSFWGYNSTDMNSINHYSASNYGNAVDILSIRWRRL